MNAILTFVIPVRHPANAVDWAMLKVRLAQTLRSVSAQDSPGWRGVVVANEGADLPPMPDGWEVVRVAFPPNPLYQQGSADKEAFYDAVRLDKGRRVLAGMLHARASDYFMVVDDDDLVSRRLVGHLRANPGAAGWHVRDGYFWREGSHLLYLHGEFSKYCGTSYIVLSDLYGLPDSMDNADEAFVRSMLGSHVLLPARLAEAGHRILPLPFQGAVYRIGHSGAHSRSGGLRSQLLSAGRPLGDPLRAILRLRRLRPLTASIRDEFFGRLADRPQRLELQERHGTSGNPPKNDGGAKPFAENLS